LCLVKGGWNGFMDETNKESKSLLITFNRKKEGKRERNLALELAAKWYLHTDGTLIVNFWIVTPMESKFIIMYDNSTLYLIIHTLRGEKK
jgi:hypothetical protein